MSFWKKYLAAATLTLIYMAASFHGMVAWHEHQHKEIYQQHNCVNITIDYNYLEPGNDAIATTHAYCIENEEMNHENDQVHEKQRYAWITWYVLSIGFAYTLTRYLY